MGVLYLWLLRKSLKRNILKNIFSKFPLARETPFECRLPDVFESTIARSNAQRRTNSTKQ